jgi:hypothetical protein
MASHKADKAHKRKYAAEDYITVSAIERLLVEQDDKCLYCTGPFDHEAPDRTWPDAPTLERLDESLAHTVDNCVLACYYCNASRKGKTVDEMKEYAMCMKLGWIKHCPACKTFYEDTDNEFAKNKSRRDGLNAQCRQCHNDRSKASRAARKLKKRALE